MNRDAVRHVATKNIHAACGDVGRGNLRENREDPAPTVGHMRGCNRDAFSRGNISDYRLFPSPLRIPSQTSAPPINAAAREGRALAALGTSPTKIPTRFAAARRFVDFLIKKGLPTREVSMKDSLRAFCRGLPFGIRRLKPILPFLGGRSDAACRVVIPLYAFPVNARMGVHAGLCGYPATSSPPCRL